MRAETSVDDTQSNPLVRAFAPVMGLPAWQVHHGYGSFLTLEFGEPRLEIREPKQVSPTLSDGVRRLNRRRLVTPRGAWHLWIYCCRWRVLSGGAEIAWSESSDETIGAAAKELDGQRLTAVEADPKKGTSVFTFDLGGSLATWPDEGVEEQWMLFMKSGDVFTYRGDGFYSLGHESRTPDDEVWQPLSPDPAV